MITKKSALSLFGNLSIKIKYFVLGVLLLINCLADVYVPFGIAAGVPYVFIVLLTLWIPGKRSTYIFGWLAAIFTAFNFAFMHATVMNLGLVVTNRFLTVVTILFSAYVVLKRKAVEELFRESENRNAKVLESIPNAMLIINQNGEIEYANTVAKDLFGEGNSGLVGQTIEELVPDSDKMGHTELRNSFFMNPKPIVLGSARDLHAKKLNGKIFPAEIGLNPIEYNDKTYVLVAVIDLTERRKIEKDLRKYADKLKASNNELLNFTGIVAHDLKEPVRNIMHLAKFILMEEETMSGMASSKLRKIKDLASYTSKLMIQLLEYSKIGMAEIHEEEVDLAPIVSDVLMSLSLKGDGTDIIVKDLPITKCDPIRVGEVFRNLVTNAIKHNNKPKAKIEIGHNSQGFYVKDNGPGIPEEVHDHVFELFNVAAVGKTKTDSSGVGLSIAKKIVEKHNGKLWFETQAGQGTTFYFTLC